MEVAGAKACFDFLLTVAGLTIPVFISDRHRGVAKWIRECHPQVKHFFDTWHIAKGIAKKMLAASKKNGFETVGKWITGDHCAIIYTGVPHLLLKDLNTSFLLSGNQYLDIFPISTTTIQTHCFQNVCMMNLEKDENTSKLVCLIT